ncbi:germination protein YpeB [Salipaludibacillus agaradhaerens]|uniref:Germination protein YpeB n=1 Tax=Salipaludibacillus agaradhaerens TaxID=76935 RepID=A0A9Q4FX79_SALAG|nr:germination protein YpeB [Salipaludibacillus agaradhaerens]MCR6096540.1 germination protein YpeB [Salipaludibacillus agaradhaerens]MCR6113901.1 germination protein YpeB [Salipaludibacillus agaradhaerens]
MARNIIITILVVVVVGAGFWGYREHEEKNAILNHTENTYQRAFHDLTYQIDLLHDEIGSTLAMNSTEKLSPSLAEVWRVSSQAQNDLGQLPLGLMPFSKTEEFLKKVGDFSYQHSIRNQDHEPLTDENYDDLKTLYGQAADIQNELRSVQSLVLKDHLRWMDAEMAMKAGEEPLNNAIVNGFKIIDDKVSGFSEVNFDSETEHVAGSDEKIYERVKNEETISQQEAQEVAKKFLGRSRLDDVKVTETGEGLDYEAYSLTIADKKHNTNITMDITKNGGHPVWMLNERDIDKDVLSLSEAADNAKSFLDTNDYDNMQLVDSKQYDNVGVFQFVFVDDKIRIYPDEVVVEVALDEGDVIGFENFSYLANHKDDREFNLELTKEEAEEKANGNLDIKEHHVAVIENQAGEEVTCHEFYGTIDNDTFRIFINAETGSEEQVEKLPNPEPVYH